MPDNFTPGTTAAPVATDDIGGVHYQRFKVGYGADGIYDDATPTTALPTGPGYLELSGSIAANGALAFAAQDVSAYRWAHIAITGTWSGTIRFSISADGTTWFNGYAGQLDAPWNPPVNTAANGLWGMPVGARYFRIVSTAWTSGTANVIVGFSAAPSAAAWSQVISGASSNTITDDASGFMEGKTGALNMVFDGTNWDRMRNVTAVDGLGSTGLLAVGAIAFDAGSSVNRRLRCDANGALHAYAPGTATYSQTPVEATTTSTVLAAAKTSRVDLSIYNNSDGELFVAYGPTASTAAFKVLLVPGAYWEMPAARTFHGVVSGIWTDGAATGPAMVTEVG